MVEEGVRLSIRRFRVRRCEDVKLHEIPGAFKSSDSRARFWAHVAGAWTNSHLAESWWWEPKHRSLAGHTQDE